MKDFDCCGDRCRERCPEPPCVLTDAIICSNPLFAVVQTILNLGNHLGSTVGEIIEGLAITCPRNQFTEAEIQAILDNGVRFLTFCFNDFDGRYMINSTMNIWPGNELLWKTFCRGRFFFCPPLIT